jgi:hypothetical protein
MIQWLGCDITISSIFLTANGSDQTRRCFDKPKKEVRSLFLFSLINQSSSTTLLQTLI